MDFSFNSKEDIKKTLSQLTPSELKGGIARDTVDEKYRSIFDALDNKNTNGILEDNEIQDLQNAAGKDGVFSVKEVKNLIKSIGLKESVNVETFVSFLSNIIGLSAKIEKVEKKESESGENTIITYAEDGSEQQKVETRDASGNLVKTVMYKNRGKDNETYEVYENGVLTGGKDEKGEYQRRERTGYGILGQTVVYEKRRNNGAVEYYNADNKCIGGEDEKGFYRCNELEDGKRQIFRGDADNHNYEMYDSNNKLIGGYDEDGEYTRNYTAENDYVDTYILPKEFTKKNFYVDGKLSHTIYAMEDFSKESFYVDGKLSHTEINEKINNKTYKKEISSSGITIEVDGEPNSKITIDFDKITKSFKGEEKEKLIEALKQMPTLVLIDLFVEATFTSSSVSEGEDGTFWSVTDKISLSGGSFDVETIVHELGHALDCIGKGNNAYYQSDNSKFSSIFNQEMKQYIAQGNQRCKTGYDKSGAYYTRHNEDGGNYATVDQQEMFAECYTLLMLGYCNSEEVIKKYFPKTLACAQEIIDSTRKKSASVRHPK